MREPATNKPRGAMVRAAVMAMALGLSPALAQVSWQTTKTTNATKNTGSCTLDASSLRIKVFPAYLDVEEEVEIRTSGTVSTANDPNTLEITAIFTLPASSVVTGALLWDGNRLLQAKLLDKFKADSIYEDLVDRDSVPPPRPIDPLILERTGTNTYRLRVYPAVLGQTRRFRIRYQLPPRIGTTGFEIRAQAAIAPLFTPGTATVTTTIENGGGVPRIGFIEAGLRREMTLPRTVFLPRSALTAATAAHATNSTRVMPLDTLRQVQVKTSFGPGSFSGHYLNLYASVGEDLLRSLGQRVEVVIFWKWHNIGSWQTTSSYRTEAQAQAASLLTLYGQLGVPGNRVGLLHDNSYNAPRAFPVASKTEPAYQQATDYLTSLQGNYVQDFINNVQFSGGTSVNGVTASKSRFYENIKLVKTLYSPDQGVTRHLIVVSAGPEFVSTQMDLNAVFDSVFQDKPISLSPVKNRSFNQVGFDFFTARQSRAISGTIASLSQADVPGFPSMNLVATVRNVAKAYDFNVTCTGGVGISCGSLEFHGKAAVPWSDTLEWEAYRSGTFAGRAVTVPTSLGIAQDTGSVLLWAGSSAPFSESNETLLGPRYGFVDTWASLLALERDSLSVEQKAAYGDSGVPRSGPIPDYLGPSPGTGGTAIAGAARETNVSTWRLEKSAKGTYLLRIPGLTAGDRIELTLHDLDGKRRGSWVVTAEAGLLRWNPAVRSGTYVLRVQGSGIQGSKIILL
jgi:hypothetical protein